MSKVHVIKDENLGGVLREFVEVDRKANVGDKVIIVKEEFTCGKYANGDVLTAEYADVKGIYVPSAAAERNGDGFIAHREYYVLEPTDIVVIDGKRYLMVKCKAEVGDKVIVTNAENTFGKYDNGSVLVAEETVGIGIYNKNVVTEEFGGNPYGFIAHDEYLVLVLLEDAAESEASPSVVDMLSNLALRLTQLERKVNEMSDRQAFRHHEIEAVHDRIDRLAHACEQSDNSIELERRLSDINADVSEVNGRIDQLAYTCEQSTISMARDVERIDADVERLKQPTTVTIDASVLAKLISKAVGE